MPEVPRFAMYAGCVLDQLSWQMQRSGLLTATARLVAQGGTVMLRNMPGGGLEVVVACRSERREKTRPSSEAGSNHVRKHCWDAAIY